MAFNSPILGPTGVGMIGDDGKLTPASREAFTTQVIALLVRGNEKGLGPKLSSIVGAPLMPVPGPKLFDPDKALVTPKDPLGDLFWFAPSPLAASMTPFLIDPEGDYQKIIVTNLYEPLVKALNLNGNIAAPLVFDPTAFLEITIDVDIPELLTAFLALTPPTIPAFAAKYEIDAAALPGLITKLPTIVANPPIPPPLPIPPIPDFDFIIFPDLFLSILTLPLEILKPDIVINLVGGIPVPDFGSIFLGIINILLDILLKALEAIGLLVILPKLLIATITIILQNLVAMLVCDVIGLVLGTGQVVKQAGKFFLLST